MPRDTLTDRERKRLDRFEKMQQNRRGRSSPAVMPSKLARTAAFAPRKKNLVTDSNFKRVYEFRPHTVVEVSGRELGTQHRDALYALFKLRAKRTEEPNPLYNPNISAVGLKAPKPTLIYYHTITTWRDILKATGRSAHVNNLGTVLRTLGSFAQRYVKRHGLAQSFQAEFGDCPSMVRKNICSAPDPGRGR
jgi:hypothetical protein